MSGNWGSGLAGASADVVETHARYKLGKSYIIHLLSLGCSSCVSVAYLAHARLCAGTYAHILGPLRWLRGCL